MLMQTCALSAAVSFEVDMHMFVEIRQVSECFYSTQTALIFRLNNSQIQRHPRLRLSERVGPRRCWSRALSSACLRGTNESQKAVTDAQKMLHQTYEVWTVSKSGEAVVNISQKKIYSIESRLKQVWCKIHTEFFHRFAVLTNKKESRVLMLCFMSFTTDNIHLILQHLFECVKLSRLFQHSIII